MSLRGTVVKVFGTRVLRSVVAVLGLLAVGRALGAAGFGVFALYQGLVIALSVLTGLGVDDAVEKRVSEGTGANVLATALAVQTVTVTVVALPLLLFRPLLDGFIGGPYTLFVIPALAARQFATLFLNTLSGEQRVDTAENLQTVRIVVFYGLGLWLIGAGYGVASLVYSFLASWALVLAAALVLRDTPLGVPTRDKLASLSRFARFNFLATVVSQRAYDWADTLVIGLFLSSAHVGAYEAAWRISFFVLVLARAVANSLFPKVSEWHAAGETGDIEDAIPPAITWSVVLVVPAAFGAALYAEDLLELFFRPDFGIAATALVILVVGKFPEAVNDVLGRVLLGIDRPDLVARIAAVTVTTNVLLNLALVYAFGLAGAAVATTVSGVVALLLTYRYLRRRVRVRFPTAATLAVVGASVLMFVVLRLLSLRVTVSSLLELLSLVSLGAAVYGVTLLLYAPLRRQVVRAGKALLY